MDTAQWPQGIGLVENTKPGGAEKKARPQKEVAVNCPRCTSTNTKFCYYNNYSLSQPRYFCKTCRRYWTEGGSLRNVPVGGGSRKNKRSTSSSSTSSPTSTNSSTKAFPDLNPQNFSPQNPRIHQGQDLNLAYNPSHYNGLSEFVGAPFGIDGKNLNPGSSASHFPVMELFKTGNISSGGLSSLLSVPVTDSNSVYTSSGFPASHEFKPSLGFSVDGLENYGDININNHGVHEDRANSSRILFPFEELKPISNGEFEQDRGEGESNGYWNGMLGSW